MSNITYKPAAAAANRARALAAPRVTREVRRANDVLFTQSLEGGLEAVSNFVASYAFEMSFGAFAGLAVYAVIFLWGAV